MDLSQAQADVHPGIRTVRAQVDRDERWQKERDERAENGENRWRGRRGRHGSGR